MKTQVENRDLLPALLIFTRQFATLVQHGVNIRQCFVLLGEDAPSPYAEVTDQLGEQVEAGRTLYEAMSITDYWFPPLYLAMIKAGEVGGVLDEFLGYLAELLENEWEFRRQGALGEDDLMLFNPAVGPSDWRNLSDERRLMTLSLWCRTMSMLLSARVPLNIALLTSAKLLPPKQQQELQQDAKQKALLPVLRSVNFLPATALTLIGFGQQADTLDLALDHLARLYRDMFRYTRMQPSKRPARHALTERVRQMIHTPQVKPDLDVILRAAGMSGEVAKVREMQQGTWTPDWSKLEQEMSNDASAPPIIRMVNVLFQNAIEQGATDILLHLDECQTTVRNRIGGEFREVMALPKFGHKPIAGRLRIMANIPLNAVPPQQGTIHIRHEGQDYDAIVEITSGEFGDEVTIRISKPDLSECGE